MRTDRRRAFFLGLTAVSMLLWLLMAESTFYRLIFAGLLVTFVAVTIKTLIGSRGTTE